jgi:hypothetical protein
VPYSDPQKPGDQRVADLVEGHAGQDQRETEEQRDLPVVCRQVFGAPDVRGDPVRQEDETTEQNDQMSKVRIVPPGVMDGRRV